ncbi:MAG TPA: PIG-L deacetylase family protein [Acidimicrobiales bacterium]|nr:PIG-L deacetylase family protein [Acidimicrobiales bacterium]
MLITAVPGTVLAVYAHPDDAEVACGGTLARWATGGARVQLVIACRGDKGTLEEGSDPDDIARLRAEEVAAGAAALGIDGYEMLGYPDGELDDGPELRGRLVATIRRVRPDAVVCPDPTAAFFGRTYINHRDHRAVGWATLDAVAPAAWSPLYFPGTGAPHRVAEVYLSGSLEPDVYVDVEPVLEAKAEALRCHQTQLRGSAGVLEAAVRRRAADAGRAAGARYAEGFRLLTPS